MLSLYLYMNQLYINYVWIRLQLYTKNIQEELNENLLKKIYCAEIGFSIFLFFFFEECGTFKC